MKNNLMNIYLIKADSFVGYDALYSFVYICESEQDCHKYVNNLGDNNDKEIGLADTTTFKKSYSVTRVSAYTGNKPKPFVLIAHCTNS